MTAFPPLADIVVVDESSDDIIKMTYDEYKIYIDDYTKKSKYPDINQ